ncbi:MAG: response regulator [Oligoflexia bacterium]|nr:MAG: response regulator [Oligoflexia bacterium]
MPIGKKVLIVEDYPEMLELMSYLLENAGYNVAAATSGNQALELIRTNHNDKLSLILLDHSLPDMTSHEVIAQLRAENLCPQVPIVICSAMAELNMIELPEGVAGTLQKPFEIDSFLNTVAKYELLDTQQDISALPISLNPSKAVSHISSH